MKFHETPLPGAYLIELERFSDERGYFARTFCEEEFAKHGLHTHWPQCNLSFNTHAGTLRGMHYQEAPHEEVKLVRCVRGAIFDAIVDVRKGSPTYLEWYGAELSAENGAALYIPKGFAHGFITLQDNSEVYYHMGSVYVPNAARGIRWDDPRIGIEWPGSVTTIATRDAEYPDYVDR